MDIEISNCGQCPFRNEEYDDYSTGHDTLVSCLLSNEVNNKYLCIDAYNQSGGYELECDYCKEWEKLFASDEHIEFDPIQCKCDELNQKEEKLDFPEECPLKQIKNINIKIKE